MNERSQHFLSAFEGSLIDTVTSQARPIRIWEISKRIWFGGGEPVELQNPILESIFEELNRSQDKSQLNPLIEPTSERAYKAAKRWIVWAVNKFSNLSKPYIIVTGDGGVVVEWRMKDNFVSVDFDEEDSEMDIIFFQINNKKDSEDFNENKLEEVLSALISYDVISANHISREEAQAHSVPYERFPDSFFGSASVTNNSRQVLDCRR